MDTVGSVMTSVIDKVFDESKETKPAEPIAVKAEEKIVQAPVEAPVEAPVDKIDPKASIFKFKPAEEPKAAPAPTQSLATAEEEAPVEDDQSKDTFDLMAEFINQKKEQEAQVAEAAEKEPAQLDQSFEFMGAQSLASTLKAISANDTNVIAVAQPKKSD